MKKEIKKHEEAYIHIPKSWYVPAISAIFILLMAANAWFFWNTKFNSEKVITTTIADLFKHGSFDYYLQMLGFGIIGNAILLIYGKLIGNFDKVLGAVLGGVLGGVLWGVLWGVLGGVIGGVLGSVLEGVLDDD